MLKQATNGVAPSVAIVPPPAAADVRVISVSPRQHLARKFAGRRPMWAVRSGLEGAASPRWPFADR